jgi:hypothetical protein
MKKNSSPNRHGVREGHATLNLPPLKKIDWSSAHAKAPRAIPIRNWKPEASKLPSADYAVITWTNAEWNALDFVFCDSQDDMPYYREGKGKNKWQDKWLLYGKGFGEAKQKYKIPSFAPSAKAGAWGQICMTDIDGKKALLIKSEMHISQDGPELPLIYFIERIISESSPKIIFTTGTAGGAKVNSRLGDVSLTNAAQFQLSGEFKDKDYKDKKFSNNWKPGNNLDKYSSPLLMPAPLTRDDMNTLISEFNAKEGTKLTWKKLVNDDIDPDDLKKPKTPFMNGIPVLTTNGYDIATTKGNFEKYAAMEMDDAAVAMSCAKHKQAFAVIRNISDPVVNYALDPKTAKNWAGKIYSTYGFYTSYNGSVAAWASIMAER